MNQRIKKLRKALDLTQQEFADRIGMKRNTIANYEIDRNEPSASVISLICREFNVNEEWLRHGTGEMFADKSRDESIIEFVNEVMAGRPDDFKLRFIHVLTTLDESDWEVLARMAARIAGVDDSILDDDSAEEEKVVEKEIELPAQPKPEDADDLYVPIVARKGKPLTKESAKRIREAIDKF